MEAFINNTQVLYSRVENVIYELAEEKPFGTPLTHGEKITMWKEEVILFGIVKQLLSVLGRGS